MPTQGSTAHWLQTVNLVHSSARPYDSKLAAVGRGWGRGDPGRGETAPQECLRDHGNSAGGASGPVTVSTFSQTPGQLDPKAS